MTKTAAGHGDLFEGRTPIPDGTTVVNERCLLRTRDGRRVIVLAGLAVSHYALGDATAEAHAMVSLVEQGWATQVQVARAFGCATRTVRRHLERFEQGGLRALGRGPGYPTGRARTTPGRTRAVHRMKSEGRSNREIATRLGVTENAVRKALRHLGWREDRCNQAALPLDATAAHPNLSASLPESSLEGTVSTTDPLAPDPLPTAHPNLSGFERDEPLPWTMDHDPAHRTGDRLYAYLGLLDDAAPLFRSGTRVPGAGVLLAVPAILRTGVLTCAREVYGSIGPAFYGLRTTILAFVLLALLRVKRPEALKEHSPQDLGRLLGLDRAPEVKTVRRKLARLAKAGRAAAFGRALAERRVAMHAESLGFLYTDGHVRVYHGRHTIPKAHVARMRISMPATTDYWVHDARGEPLFVVTAEANAGLAKMLPPILAEIRALVGDRRVTIVFDRGGWSPALFQKILAKDFDILTYRKGKSRRVPRRLFSEHSAVIDGRKVSYLLADCGTHLLGGRLRLRQVTRLSPDGHQTPIVTSRRDLAAVEVAYRMFERWREENFFKYLRDEYALDALVDYAVEPDDAEREVPNPQRKKLTAKVRAARAEVARLSARYGLHALGDTLDERRRTLEAFQTEHTEEARAVWEAFARLDTLVARAKKVPARVPVKQVVSSQVVKLSTERKHISNVLKMVAYQAESELVHAIARHYRRAADEGRTLVQNALACPADIDVAEDELRVTLAPLSSAHRSRTVAALCEELNAAAARFPGTRLRLRFGVAGVEKRTG